MKLINLLFLMGLDPISKWISSSESDPFHRPATTTIGLLHLQPPKYKIQSISKPEMKKTIIFFFFFLSLLLLSSAFESDELLLNDDEFEGVGVVPTVKPRPSPSSPSSSESKHITFTLEHAFESSAFSSAGVFTARHRSGQSLTKLRFARNNLTAAEREAFKRVLEEDGFYKVRVPSNVANPSGKEYVVSSVRARCISTDTLDEYIVIHTEGVNILAVSYGSAGACPYPRLLKFPSTWAFNSHIVLKNNVETARKTPTFTEELIQTDIGEGEGVQPPEKSFLAKYWMYLVPLGLIVMNTVTQAMNMPEEQAAGGQPAAQGQAVAQRAPNGAAVRRRQ